MAESLRTKTANRLKEIRLAKGISQGQLAAQIGVDRTVINKIENGRWSFSIDALERISKVLEFDLQLVTVSETEKILAEFK